MSEVFRNVLNAGFQGSIVILMVLLLRLILKNAPKKYICLLWILAGIRLLMPFSFESELSLQPAEPIVTQQAWEDLRDYGQIIPENAPSEAPQPYVPEQEYPVTESVPEHPEVTVTVEREINLAVAATYLWVAGMAVLAMYSLIAYLRLKRRVGEAVHLSDDVWECPGLDTAFILGLFRPRIYIPTGLSESSCRYILDHERCHLERRDHWVKLIGFVALTVHWFNPLVWLGYFLLCRDVEMACDESVVANMSLDERKQYSAALLECSTNRAHWGACPVAFGEVSVKQRILSVLNYRRKSFWISVIGIIAIIFVAVCFLTDPAEQQIPAGDNDWENEIRAVLEEIQSRENYAIIEQRQFEGEKALNDSADMNFFRYGDNWLTVCYSDDLDSGGWQGYLHLQGKGYEAVSDDGRFEWQLSELNDVPEPWLYTFDMDAQEAAAISRKVTDEGYEIRLLVQAPYLDLGGSYYVDFSFDHEGNFRNAVLHASGMEELMGGMVETNMTTIMYIHKNNEVDIAGTIEQYAATLPGDYDVYLGTVTLEEPDWNIRVTLADITATGLTFRITQTGELIGQQLFYGQYFDLERWNGSGWEALEPIEENWGFTLEAFNLPEDTTTDIPINWKWLYGELTPGTYRIGKNVSNVVEYKVGVDGIMTPQGVEETNYSYYASFEITKTVSQYADGTLGALMQVGAESVNNVYLMMDNGYAPLSREDELMEVLELLGSVRYGAKISDDTVAMEEDGHDYKRILLNSMYAGDWYSIPNLQFDESCETVLAYTDNGAAAVYAVEDPEAIRDLFDRAFNTVQDEKVTVSAFATAEEPWIWARNLSLGAVENAYVTAQLRIREGDLINGSGYGGAMRTSRFEELLQILGSLTEDAFAPKELEGGHTLDYFSFGYDTDWVTSVTIADGANSETVILRCLGKELELIFCGNTGGVVKGDLELQAVRCWTVRDETLLAYMQELMSHCAHVYNFHT